MKVTAKYSIKGRGWAVELTDLPTRGLILGVLLHQGDHAWKISGTESRCSMFQEPTCLVVLLRPLDGAPEAPELGEIFL